MKPAQAVQQLINSVAHLSDEELTKALGEEDENALLLSRRFIPGLRSTVDGKTLAALVANCLEASPTFVAATQGEITNLTDNLEG